MPELAIPARDYFISRTDADKSIALAIAAIIREAGFTTWLQDEDFGHASFMARMEQGFESGARVIALLSAAYQRSAYCRKEYNAVLSGDPLNLKERLIVLRVDDCAAAGNLRDMTFRLTTSQPRSLLSMARLKSARSRTLRCICSLVRIAQTCLGCSGGFGPTSLPLFQGLRRTVDVSAF